MSGKNFIFLFVLMLLMQMFLTLFCQIGPFIYISLLPAMIFCIPTSRPTWSIMLIAFVSALAVDLLAEGVAGLNAAALVPVAALQKPLIRLMIDEDIVERHYRLSFHDYGFEKVCTALAVEYSVFFILFVLLDSAGTRSFGFNLLHIVCSVCISFIFGIFVVNVLSPRSGR